MLAKTTPLTLKKIGQAASQSLLEEVALAPKPGLVDPFSSGAHRDMDYTTFLSSIHALSPFFTEYIVTGYCHKGTPTELFRKIRQVGIKAETAMLKETLGINTHKGANFSFALVLSSIGQLLQQQPDLTMPFSADTTQQIFTYITQMSEDLLKKDFSNLQNKKQLSYGEKLFLEYGITGIRGEAALGYPILQDTALPFLISNRYKQKEKVELLLLLKLMSVAEDSNVINRGGITAWKALQQQACSLEKALEFSSLTVIHQKMHSFDQELIKKNLSPGGAADLLALSIFFSKLLGIRA